MKKLRTIFFAACISCVALIFDICSGYIIALNINNSSMTVGVIIVTITPLFSQMIKSHKSIMESDKLAKTEKVHLWIRAQSFFGMLWTAGYLVIGMATLEIKTIQFINKSNEISETSIYIALICAIFVIMLIMWLDHIAYKDEDEKESLKNE